MRKTKTILLLLLVCVGIVRIWYGARHTMAAGIDANNLMQKINSERTSRNIPALITSTKLVAAANSKTADMLKREYFDHVDPDGNYVWPMIAAAGYEPYKTLGENLAIDFVTEEGMVKAWINSPSHRDNMLREDFEDQGVSSPYGMFENRYTNITASLFGTLAVKISPPPPSPLPQVKANPSPTPPAPKTSPTPKPAPLPVPAPVAPPTAEPPPPPIVSPPPVQPPDNRPALTLEIIVPEEPATTTTSAGILVAERPLNVGEASVYETLRTIFISLTVAFLAVVALDQWKRRGRGSRAMSPMIWLVALAAILTLRMY